MSNSEVNDSPIDWTTEASAPLSSWADEMDELDALEPIIYQPMASTDDSQPADRSPLASSCSSSDAEEDRRSSSTREYPSTDVDGRSSLRDSYDRLPRSGSNNNLSRQKTPRRELRDSSNDLSGTPPKPSVKEEVPFPTTAPFVAFITNVHIDATRDDISKMLEPTTGVPKSIKIILDKETGRPRGFCYVEFMEAIGLQAAIDADGTEFMTQLLHIVVAERKREKPAYNRFNSFNGLRNSGGRDSSDSSSKFSRFDHQDSNKGRHPARMDAPSPSSKGKLDSQPFRPRKDDSRYQAPRSNSFSFEKKHSPSRQSPSKFNDSAAGSYYREKSPVKVDTPSKFNGARKMEDRPMNVGNMFSALRLANEDL